MSLSVLIMELRSLQESGAHLHCSTSCTKFHESHMAVTVFSFDLVAEVWNRVLVSHARQDDAVLGCVCTCLHSECRKYQELLELFKNMLGILFLA